MLEYHSVSLLAEAARQDGVTISRLVLRDQAAGMETTEEAIMAAMVESLEVMRRAVASGSAPGERSISGLTGGDGRRMGDWAASGPALAGPFCARAIATALAVAECNAAMGKIVAAPTAGSCGILPGAVLTMMEERGASQEAAVMGLITAGAIGLVIAAEASISGAEGGCQAECGSAAAMAAGALVEMAGGTPDMVCHACALALQNQLGLVCDPVAGLVEVPCINRNAGGVMCAITAADMALAGVESVIPVDEVITAMREIGDAMPGSLRETAQGGLAATPTGRAIKERLFAPGAEAAS
ncbi:MAG: L-serine ammonia-lyase, iron-sulfur-dependent, subunit alpha [Planctomycetes bacterium]|nr:L-serine ammonia-lyase, iron-sulfur-dependent, subunit alpha [Planctomycetota bacterium]